MEAAALPANERRRVRRGRNRAQIPAFGNWDDYDHQHQFPITQFFDYCSKPPLQLHDYTGYVNHVDLLAPELDQFHHGINHYNYNYNNAALHPQPHFDYYNKTIVDAGDEVKGGESRRQRRRRSYLDNINRKVFDVTEEASNATSVPMDGRNDAVVNVTPDLYDVASMDKKSPKSNAKDEDLYKIPPELLRKSKPKKMKKFFAKCFVTICASY